MGVYDVLYVMIPLTAAICAKDSQGGFCLLDIVKGSVPPAAATSSSSIASTGSNTTTIGTGGNSTTPAVRMSMQQSLFNIQDYTGVAITPKALYITLSSAASKLIKRASSSSGNTTTTSSPSTSNNSTSSTSNANATSTNSTSTGKGDITPPASIQVTGTGTGVGVTGLLPNSTTFRAGNLPWFVSFLFAYR